MFDERGRVVGAERGGVVCVEVDRVQPNGGGYDVAQVVRPGAVIELPGDRARRGPAATGRIESGRGKRDVLQRLLEVRERVSANGRQRQRETARVVACRDARAGQPAAVHRQRIPQQRAVGQLDGRVEEVGAVGVGDVERRRQRAGRQRNRCRAGRPGRRRRHIGEHRRVVDAVDGQRQRR